MRTTRNVINLAMVVSLWLLSGLAQAGQTPGNTSADEHGDVNLHR